MDRMKTFVKYALLLVAFYFVSNGLIYLANNGMYKNFSGEVLEKSDIKIEISESKTTTANGYVKGKITNNTGVLLDGKFLKLDLYSGENINLGSESIRVDNFPNGASRDFEIKFKYGRVNYYKIDFVDAL